MWGFFKRLFIVLVLLLAGADVARASSTEIRATIAAVRIIVVSDDDRITQIYQNTDQDVAPQVRRTTVDGEAVVYSLKIAEQYRAYHQTLPSLIETLYAML